MSRSRSRGKPAPNYQPKDRYRGRRYEDDPRAAPPGRLVRLSPEMVSGCGCSAAMCLAATGQTARGLFRLNGTGRVSVGHVSA